MRFLTYAAILAAIWLPSGAIAAPHFIPDCAGSVEIAHAHVVRVEKNGAMILEDGRAVMLEGIRLAGADGAPQELSERALAALREMALAGPVTFTATPPKEDRYDRVRAQAFGDAWFQAALLEKGLARVAIAPDRNECAPDLYEAEQRGRASHAGLWASAANMPRQVSAMPNAQPQANAAPQQPAAPHVLLDITPVAKPQASATAPPRQLASAPLENSRGSFQLVQGWVTNVGSNDGKVFVDFGSNGQQIFSAVIAPEDRRAFRDFDLDGLVAHHIRVRGIVQDFHGRPQIALSNPAQIEVLN